MQTTEPLYTLRVKLTDGKLLELRGYKDTMELLAHVAKSTGRFSSEDVACVYPLEFNKHCRLITHDKKLMIWGAGRAGTTFLIRLLTRLDLFTGYIPYKEGGLKESEGGCEFGIQSINDSETPPKDFVLKQFERSPFVLKVLVHGYLAKKVIFHYGIPIGHVIIPVRDHIEVAKSRMGENIPWAFMQATEGYQVLAADIVLGKTVEAVVLADIPMTFIRFPDIVKDEQYCWNKVNRVFSDSFDIHLEREKFREEFNQLSDFSISKYSKQLKEKQSSGVQRRY
ncbi:MAG: hypothetical protein ACXABY_19040 [Candidatus Thorarchaeota archaeon]|jgi:hypothetical protein